MKKKANPSPQKPKPAGTQIPDIVDEAGLLSDLRSLIQSARQRIATVACSTQTLLYWHVGRRLLNENLQGGRAAYGKQILVTVSRELTTEFGQAFTLRALYRAIQLYQCFTDEAIVSTLSTQLSWSHFIELLPIKDPLARDFYAEMCRIERWDVRTLTYPPRKSTFSCIKSPSWAIIRSNKTRQGYARKRILKPAGYFFAGCHS